MPNDNSPDLTEDLNQQPADTGQPAEAPAAAPDKPDTLASVVRDTLAQARTADTAEKAAKRDPKGKFTKDAEKASDPAAPKAEDKSLDPEEAAKAQPAAEQQTAKAPKSWTPEEQQLFAQLPTPLQATIARREAERDKQVRLAQDESAKASKRYAGLDQAFQTHAQRLTLRGEQPQQAAARLLDLEAVYERDPLAVITHLARQAGLNLNQLVAGGTQPQPATDDLDPVLADLKRRVDERDQADAAQKQQALEARSRQAGDTIATFKAEADPAGNPKYPHYDQLENEIAFEIVRLQAQDKQAGKQERPMGDYLREAYEAAAYANPTTRQALIDAEASKRAAETTRKASEQASKARQTAGAAVRGGSGTAAPGAPTLRGIIGETLATHNLG